MATAFVLLVGVLLPCRSEPLRFRRVLLKAPWEKDLAICSHKDYSLENPMEKFCSVTWGRYESKIDSMVPNNNKTPPLGSTEINGAKCSHHSECHSDCCLIDFDNSGAFCAPKAGYTTMCLPQTKGATNILCPCRLGLSCIARDLLCPRRCHVL